MRRHCGFSRPSELIPITEGIENSNYKFIADGKAYVFTIFEVWKMPQIEYYVQLMRHLAKNKMPVPVPVCPPALWEYKPGLVIPFIESAWLAIPSPQQCRLIGDIAARLHLAVADFEPFMNNPRNADWRWGAANKVRSTLSQNEYEILDEEMARDAEFSRLPLPATACHCDLFRNNVLWRQNAVSAIIDFYFGGNDILIFDLAVCACDWCFDADRKQFNPAKLKNLIAGYTARRRLCDLEKERLADAFCVAALRFWLSRLFDIRFPRRAEVIIPHNPDYFKAILLAARQLCPDDILSE